MTKRVTSQSKLAMRFESAPGHKLGWCNGSTPVLRKNTRFESSPLLNVFFRDSETEDSIEAKWLGTCLINKLVARPTTGSIPVDHRKVNKSSPVFFPETINRQDSDGRVTSSIKDTFLQRKPGIAGLVPCQVFFLSTLWIALADAVQSGNSSTDRATAAARGRETAFESPARHHDGAVKPSVTSMQEKTPKALVLPARLKSGAVIALSNK